MDIEPRSALEAANAIPQMSDRIDEYRRLGKTFPEFAPIWFNLAKDLLQSGHRAAARDAIAQVLAISPTMDAALPQSLRALLEEAAPAVADPVAARVGHSVAGCEVAAIAARSSVQVLYEAVRGDGERVSLRFLPGLSASAPLVAARMAREAMAPEAPCSPRVLSCERETDGTPFQVLERLAGKPLAALGADGPLTLEAALRVATDVARALVEQHRRGLAHGQIHPELVLWDEASRATHLLGLCGDGKPVEWPPAWIPFAAPGHGSHPAARDDVYGIGLLVYWAVAGRLPPSRETLTTPLLSTAQPRSARPVDAAFGEAIDRVIGRALAWLPEQRFGDAGELLAALETIPLNVTERPTLVAPPVAAPASAVTAIRLEPTAIARRAPPSTRHAGSLLPVALGVLAGLAGSALAIWLLLR